MNRRVGLRNDTGQSLAKGAILGDVCQGSGTSISKASSLSTDEVRLSVIIPVLDGLPYLKEQLAALGAEDTSWVWELIAVDNGSTDGSLEVLQQFASRRPNVRVIREPVRGKSRALNRGAASAQGDFLIFLDQDDVVAPGYLNAMVAALEDHVFVASRLDSSTLNSGWVRGSRPLPQEDGVDSPFGFLPCATGCSIGLHRSAFEAVAGFDPSVAVTDDVDLSWRLQLSGVPLHFAPDAVVSYRYRTSLRKIFHQGRAYGTAGPTLYRRYKAFGMPRRPLRLAFRFHLAALVRAVRIRSKTDVARWLFLIGLRIGIIEGCIRNRVLYL